MGYGAANLLRRRNTDTDVGGPDHRETVPAGFPPTREEMYEDMVTEPGTKSEPVTARWEQAQVDALGADKGFLPEEYWPEGYVHPTPPTDPTSPVTNPKEGAGASKPPTWSVMPRWVMLLVGRVMQIGAAKYDAFNYRDAPITASTYEDAMERHAALWFDGEDNDPETGVSHLASVIACAALLLDSQAGSMLVDNRQKTGKVRASLDALERLMKSSPLPPKNPNAPSLQKAPA